MTDQEFDFAVFLSMVQNIETEASIPTEELAKMKKLWKDKYSEDNQKYVLTNRSEDTNLNNAQ